MSEKKTAEIKLRIEPSVKAQWQHLAAEEEIGLSELVVKAVTDYTWAAQNKKLDGLKLVDNDISLIANDNVPEGEAWVFGPVDTKVVPTSDEYETLLMKTPVGRCANCGKPKGWEAVCSTCGVSLNGNSPVGVSEDDAFLPRTTELARKFSSTWKPWDDAA